MKKHIFQILEDFNYWRIVGFLEGNGIHYIATKADSLFPSLNQIHYFGQIEIFEKDRAIVEDFLQGGGSQNFIVNVTTTTPTKGKPWYKSGYYWLVAYAVLMSILVIRYYYIVQATSSTKHFSYEWSPNAQVFYVRSKKTNEITQIHYDRNYDNNTEYFVYFVKGQKSLEYWDNDEDGFYEKNAQFNKKQQIVAVNSDENQDGLIDKFYFVVETGDTLFFTDENQNGVFELLKKK